MCSGCGTPRTLPVSSTGSSPVSRRPSCSTPTPANAAATCSMRCDVGGAGPRHLRPRRGPGQGAGRADDLGRSGPADGSSSACPASGWGPARWTRRSRRPPCRAPWHRSSTSRTELTAGLLDDVVGTGFTLIGYGVDPREGLSAQHLELLDALEVRCVTILESADHPSTFQAAAQSRRLVAVDTAPGDYFGSAGVMALPVRPDFYLFEQPPGPRTSSGASASSPTTYGCPPGPGPPADRSRIRTRSDRSCCARR
jgi:hypothetical protein